MQKIPYYFIFLFFIFNSSAWSAITASQGYLQLEQIRRQAGMLHFKRNSELETAAQGHANYLIINNITGHTQSSNLTGFTGVNPTERISATDYPTHSISENVSTGQASVEDSIDGLMSAIYHRFGFLDPAKDEIGIGIQSNQAATQPRLSYVYNMGDSLLARLCFGKDFTSSGRFYPDVCQNGIKIGEADYNNALNRLKSRNPEVIAWPANGANNIPPAFFEESPDPLPDFAVSGYPISIEFNDFYIKKEIKLIEFLLFDSVGNAITHTRILSKNTDPNQRLNNKQFVLFPLDRLNWNSSYQVSIRYLLDGVEKNKTWQFKTRKPANATVFNITGNNENIEVGSGAIFAVYIKPTSAQDSSLGRISASFSAGAQITINFADQNTLLLTFKGQVGDIANITTSNGKQFKITLVQIPPLITQAHPAPEGSCYTNGVQANLNNDTVVMPHILVDGKDVLDVTIRIKPDTDPLAFEILQVQASQTSNISCRSGSFSFSNNELHLPDVLLPNIGFFNAELKLIDNQLVLNPDSVVNTQQDFNL